MEGGWKGSQLKDNKAGVVGAVRINASSVTFQCEALFSGTLYAKTIGCDQGYALKLSSPDQRVVFTSGTSILSASGTESVLNGNPNIVNQFRLTLSALYDYA